MVRVATVNDVKITGMASTQIERHWGHQVAREYYVGKGLIPPELFDEVYCDGVEKVMARSPEMFSVWSTKQTSGTCASITSFVTFSKGLSTSAPIVVIHPNARHTSIAVRIHIAPQYRSISQIGVHSGGLAWGAKY